MEEDDAEVGAVVVRLDDEAAVHVGVAARLVDEQPADVVEPLEREAPLVEDRRAFERLDAAGDDPERLAAGVVVDGLDQEPVKFGGRFSRNAVTPSREVRRLRRRRLQLRLERELLVERRVLRVVEQRLVIAIPRVGAAA